MSAEKSRRYPSHNMHQTRIPSLRAPHPQIDETASIPLQSGLLDTHMPWLAPSSWPDESENGSMPLHNRTMPIKHGRSAELTHDPARETPMRMYFADPFGRWYAVLNTKGNNAHKPNTRHDPNLSPPWSIRGYMSDQYRMRCERTSRLFREHDIDAEWPIHMKRPAYLIVPDQATPATRKELITYASTHQEQDPQYHEPNPEALQAVFAQFEPTVLVRAMKMSERIWDLPNLSTPEMHELVLTAVQMHNFDLTRREKDGSYDPRLHGGPIDASVSTQEQVDQFMLDVLPRRIGRNVGLMHKLGVTHHYLHPGNITLMGEIVDLDSPTGHAVLGYGPDATMKERIGDIRMFFTEGASYAFFPLSEGADRESFYAGFFDAYCRARELGPDSLESHLIQNKLDLSTDLCSFLEKEVVTRFFNTAQSAVEDLMRHPDSLKAEDEGDNIRISVDDSYQTADELFDQFWQECRLDAWCDNQNAARIKGPYEPIDNEGFRKLIYKALHKIHNETISRVVARSISQALTCMSQDSGA